MYTEKQILSSKALKTDEQQNVKHVQQCCIYKLQLGT